MDVWQFITENLIWIIIGIFVMLIIIGICIANFSIDSYYKNYEKNRKITTSFWDSNLQFARYVSENIFNSKIKIKTNNQHQNYYSPSSLTISISDEIALENSVTGISVVAHEFGHALQHLNNPEILINNFKFNNFVKMLGNLNWIIMLLTLILTLTINYVITFVGLGLIVLNFIIAIFLKLSTAKLEKNASLQAIELIKSLKIFNTEEIVLLKKFMNSAKMTYTADFFRALLGWTGLVRKTQFFS